MSRSTRKTIDVADLRNYVNSMLKDSNNEPESAAGRAALATLLERVLMNTGNYRGFAYLPPLNEGFTNADDTRRKYL